MKFKKIISFIMSAIITVTYVSFSEKLSKNDTLSTVAALNENATYNSWQQAYRTILDEYINSEGYEESFARYELYDADSNGIPELFISGGEYHYADLYVYTFANNKLIKLGTGNIAGASGIAYVVPNKNYVFFKGGNQGSYWIIVYELMNNQFIKIATLEDTSIAVTADYYGYKFNDIKVSKSQYDSYVEQYTSRSISGIGRERSFNNLGTDIELVESFNSWQEAYKLVLIDYMQSEYYDNTVARYELYDADSNGIPELFISGGEYHYADLYVYTFANNNLIDLVGGIVTGAYGSANIVPTKSYIFFKGGNQGWFWTQVYELKNNQLKKIATLEDTSIAVTADYYGYKFNDIKVSKSQYDSYVEQYTSDNISGIGRERVFENIHSDFITTTTTKIVTTTTTTRKIVTTTTTKKTTTTPKRTTTITTTMNNSYADAGPALGDISSAFYNYDVDKAIIKPILSLSRIELSLEEAKANPIQNIKLSVKNAEKKYCATGIHICWDSRLSLNGDEQVIEPDKAVKDCGASAIKETHGIFVATWSPEDKGKDGVMWSFPLIIPSDCKSGDVYPIQIQYINTENAKDIFTNSRQDEQGQLMNAWTFTKGIVQGYIKITDDEVKHEYSLGDVNNDSQINAVDASSVLAYYAMLSTNKNGDYNASQKQAADVNNDGQINAVDASCILSYYAYVSTSQSEVISLAEFMKR